jgi:acyl-CoA synthetase (AMP-forming)/AMP-acid ligase II
MRLSRPVPADRARKYVRLGYWDDRQLRDGVESAAQKRPDKVAVVDNHRSLSWWELEAEIRGGVQRLTEEGVGATDVVVLIGGNTVEAVVGYQSLLRSGSTVALLDRRCGLADLRAVVDAVSPALVVLPTGESGRLRTEVAERATMHLEEFVGGAVGVPGGPWPEPDRNTPAVVLFTSGTTDRPKGVMHSLNTLSSGARNMTLTTGADEHSVIYLVSPLTSITGIMQMHLAADCHATLILDDAFDPEAALDRINGSGATILGGAPVIIERLIGALDRREDKGIALRTLALGGSVLSRAFLERVADRYGIDVIRVYGSSEAPNTTGRLPGVDAPLQLVDDGALMPGSEVRVGSSEHSQEGLIRGPAVFLGYLHEADNQASFEGEWYRSGDLVEVTDARMTVVGRMKEIVNRNGFKISLNEIDAAMLEVEGIVESAGFGLLDPVTGERLAVAVVPKEGAAITLETVVAQLRARGIATRKLPEHVVIWDGPLPRTLSGKVIRSQLVREASSMRSFLADRLGATEREAHG